MSISLWIEELEFSGGENIKLESDSCTILVGPNNSGKTSCLREITKFLAKGKVGPVLRGITVKKSGEKRDLKAWLDSHVAFEDSSYGGAYFWMKQSTIANTVGEKWSGEFIGDLAELLTNFVGVEDRLNVVRPPDAIEDLREAPKHPLHVLFRDEKLESLVAAQMLKAFGAPVTLNRAAGNKCPFHFGNPPKLEEGETSFSRAYVDRLARLPVFARARSRYPEFLWNSDQHSCLARFAPISR
jgi:hypothetical protein